MATQSIFSDLDLVFTKHPLTKDVTKRVDASAVNQSLKNLLLTNNFERPFKSGIGTPIKSLMFEPITPMLRVMLKTVIEQTIFNYEPRVSLEDIGITFNEENNSIDISIYYYILNTSNLQRFDFTLERTR